MNKSKFKKILINKPEIKIVNNELHYKETWENKPTIPNNIKKDRESIYNYLIDTQNLTIDEFFIDVLTEYNPNFSLKEHDELKEYFNNIIHYNPNIEVLIK